MQRDVPPCLQPVTFAQHSFGSTQSGFSPHAIDVSEAVGPSRGRNFRTEDDAFHMVSLRAYEYAN
jgi:hypothetical protein